MKVKAKLLLCSAISMFVVTSCGANVPGPQQNTGIKQEMPGETDIEPEQQDTPISDSETVYELSDITVTSVNDIQPVVNEKSILFLKDHGTHTETIGIYEITDIPTSLRYEDDFVTPELFDSECDYDMDESGNRRKKLTNTIILNTGTYQDYILFKYGDADFVYLLHTYEADDKALSIDDIGVKKSG